MSELLNNMSKKSFPPLKKKNTLKKLFYLEKIVLDAKINFKCDVLYVSRVVLVP